MTIGLVLLGIVAILIFFGVSERFFRNLGISNWLAFILVLALVVGAVAPSITIGNAFALNVGGFLVPLVIMAVLMVVMRFSTELLKSITAILAVAAVAVATRMLIEPSNSGLIFASSLIVGFAGGLVAFLVGQSRLATLAAAMGGIILGDIITNFLYTYGFGGYIFSLGSYGVFDSVVLASVFGILVYEGVAAIKSTAEKYSKRTKTSRVGLVPVGAFEAGEDVDLSAAAIDLTDESSTLGGENNNTEAAKDNDYQLLTAVGETETEADNFFDEYV